MQYGMQTLASVASQPTVNSLFHNV